MKTEQRRLPRGIREQLMIDAAVAAFSRGDYHTVRVEEIAEAAGTSKPTMYHYLGSKEGIFNACVRRESERLVEVLRAAVHDPGAPGGDDPLRRGFRAFFGFVVAHRGSWTVLYRRAAAGPAAAAVGGARERVLAEVTELITTCGELPEGTRERDAALLARIAVSTADAFADWLLDHPEESPDTLADHVAALTWAHLEMRGAPAGA
ncbi:TetR/AcrR family transcriptional regulator [Nocardiopsis flavescens]|uniref:DNA-binding transcriptional regulator, AcrR family n=1 Tax=Nocardiopsis flavescens TaxID=758803 RepID=A0A1M6BG78_9ACTN|nr:TetR/AcrR family transcriptional regulator [Nocardiopsis flavescens]SHI47780.1 DNA-binding transcriptional regulator, AcrR family [Nocardiopsis flavescens]